MLIDKDHSVLLVVDVQQRLLPAIHDSQRLLDHVRWLVQVARKIGVPVVASEQYPQGLGVTHPEVRNLLAPQNIVEKRHFSCVATQCLDALPDMQRPQVVVCGTEAHVCVLQTVLDLREQGKQVFVVADAVASRDPENKALALQRMRQHGIDVVSREMVAFEWLKQAGTPLFREISTQFLR